MRGPGGGCRNRVRHNAVIVTGCVIVLGWAVVGRASAGGLETPPTRMDQLEALAFDPFRLVTDREQLAAYEAALKPALGAAEEQSGQPVTSSTAPAVATSGRREGNPVPSSTTAGITSLTSAAALVKVFVCQALLIAPRPPLRTPIQPPYP